MFPVTFFFFGFAQPFFGCGARDAGFAAGLALRRGFFRSCRRNAVAVRRFAAPGSDILLAAAVRADEAFLSVADQIFAACLFKRRKDDRTLVRTAPLQQRTLHRLSSGVFATYTGFIVRGSMPV